MKRFIQFKFLKVPFVRRVSILVGGTAIGQLIAILTLPVLTRLYSPDSFSVLAVYVSLLSLIAVISGMCFEYAVPLPKLDRIAAALCMLALISVLIFTVMTFFVVAFIPEVFNALTNGKIDEYLWLLPMGVFAVGLYNALQYWSTRKKKFGLISKTRVTQSLSGTCVKLGAGFLLNGWPVGLIFGQLLAQGAGFIGLGLSLLKEDWKIFRRVKLQHLKLAIYRYDKFPRFTTLEVFANTAGIQVPIILIAYYAIGAEAGYLMIAMQLLSAPTSMISGAVSQVYLAEGADKYHQGELEKFTKITILNLLKISILPILTVAIVAPFLMPYFLGNEWARTGVLISWMAPWFLIQFITSPVSTSLYITSNQKLAFVLQLAGFVIRVGSIFFAAYYYNNYIGEFYAVSGLIFYSIYLIVVLRVLSRENILKKEV